ncbi:protein sarah [Centruroides vittatus]|uniref:protein sarah n=1 Tax=Centruroides vittatus TaxID=120091 RepID=UPI00350FC8DA
MKLFDILPKTMDFENITTDFEENGTELEDIPTSLIITNVDISVYNDEEQKARFEALFRHFEEEATFQYFKSFRRARVNYSSPAFAAKARIHCHKQEMGDSIMNCYFAQPKTDTKDSDSSDSYLQPPSPVRQFLISPPASPPEGWAPHPEAEPTVNMELLAAIANLGPGETHELHPPSESQPGIVVHVCEDPQPPGPKLKIVQTRCPERSSSTDSDSP